MSLRLRPLTPADAAETQAIFLAAVAGTGAHYSEAEREAWAGGLKDPAAWVARTATQDGVLARHTGRPVGFMTLGPADYLDMAYVHPAAAGQGIGRALHDAIVDLARTRGSRHLTTHASLAAQGFFAALGWTVLAEEDVRRGTAHLRRYCMQRAL